MKSVLAIIVTYNRLKLLQKAIEAVLNQSYAVTRILIVNNGSTDGTAQWLAGQNGLTVIDIQKNIGASGGFYTGIKAAANFNADWWWVMDDDTICEYRALENLVAKVDLIDKKIGFIGSRCNWRNGEPHLMNVPDIKPMLNRKIPFNQYDQSKVLLTSSSSWVSILLNPEAVKAVGLPYKEFFFWSDDLEFTQRITRAGYLGFYCVDSIVLHDTQKNYCPDFYGDTANNVWKYHYGFRNEFFLKKKDKGFFYFIGWLIIKVSYTSLKVIRVRKDHHLKFIRVLLSAAWNSLFFNPIIEKLTL